MINPKPITFGVPKPENISHVVNNHNQSKDNYLRETYGFTSSNNHSRNLWLHSERANELYQPIDPDYIRNYYANENKRVAVHLLYYKDIELLSHFPWISELYKSKTKKEVRSALYLMFKKINELLSLKKFESCDRILREIRMYDLDISLMTGLLRITYAAKEKIPSWTPMLVIVKNILEKEDEKSLVLLRGLWSSKNAE